MTKTLQEKNYLFSSDLCLCATLCTLGYAIEKVMRDNPQKVVFVVKKDKNLDDLTRKIFSHELNVEPLKFFGCLRELKTLIYNVKN